MNLQGAVVTLRSLSLEGAENPKAVDPGPAVRAYQKQLEKRLKKAGLDVHVTTEGSAAVGTVITCRLVRVNPGRPGMTFLFGSLLSVLFKNNSVFEVEGQVGYGTAPVTQFHAVGKAYQSSGTQSVRVAGTMAGTLMAKQVVKALQVR